MQSYWSVAALVAAIAAGLAPAPIPPADGLPIDRGAASAWQAINKLRTTGSLLQTTAHPDDEQGGMLALASRRWGARTALLTLNRGEAGDNAIGPELFDALGLIRTDELLQADQFYGLDEQYFTLAADYGFSKRMDEALERWDRHALLGDMVRVIRAFRPIVVVSRWEGTPRDGHGQHQAAGALTPEAVAAAADPAAYPELAAEGLAPWTVLRLYVGGARENEAWQVRVDPGQYDPVIGDSVREPGPTRSGAAAIADERTARPGRWSGAAVLLVARRGGDTAARRELLRGASDRTGRRVSPARPRGADWRGESARVDCAPGRERPGRLPVDGSGRLGSGPGARPGTVA